MKFAEVVRGDAGKYLPAFLPRSFQQSPVVPIDVVISANEPIRQSAATPLRPANELSSIIPRVSSRTLHLGDARISVCPVSYVTSSHVKVSGLWRLREDETPRGGARFVGGLLRETNSRGQAGELSRRNIRFPTGDPRKVGGIAGEGAARREERRGPRRIAARFSIGCFGCSLPVRRLR